MDIAASPANMDHCLIDIGTMAWFLEFAEGKFYFNMPKAILRIFSYMYHLVLGLFLLAISGLTFFSESLTLRLEMLPWDEPVLSYVVFFGTLMGLISLVLAVKGKVRLLFRLWTLVVFVLMVYGYFFTRYGFHSPGHFWSIVLLILGALAAILGSWTKVQKPA